jgi:hypothetical protein
MKVFLEFAQPNLHSLNAPILRLCICARLSRRPNMRD